MTHQPDAASGLKVRLLSALVLAPLVIAAVILGGWVFYALIAAVFGLSLQEWARLSQGGGRVQWGIMLAGIAYLSLSCWVAIWLRDHIEGGLYLLLYVFFAIWASDSFAYAVGKTVGGPKLAPSISPKKTWSGLIGGCAGAGLVVSLYAALLDGNGHAHGWVHMPLYAHAGLGFVLGVVGQAGDLMISVLKRRAGLKDTGNLIPGHGGLLDRIDALLLALPVSALALMACERWAY